MSAFQSRSKHFLFANELLISCFAISLKGHFGHKQCAENRRREAQELHNFADLSETGRQRAQHGLQKPRD